MSTALPVTEESRTCIKQPALLFEAIQAAFSASLHVLIGVIMLLLLQPCGYFGRNEVSDKTSRSFDEHEFVCQTAFQ